MLKVKNKKVVDEIAGITYKANRKRNLLTVFAIVLTTFLITVIMAVGGSYWNTISERKIRMAGMDYDIELSEPRQDQVEKIRSMEQVKYAGVAVKCALLEQYQDLLLDKTRLYWLDETCWEKQTIPALESFEGSYPQKEDEIMLGRNTLKAMGIQNPEKGMKLAFTYFTLEEGSNEELLEKEFILSGWYVDYSKSTRGYVSKAFFEKSGVKQTDFTQGTLKITLKNPLYSEKDIEKIQEAIVLNRNQYIDADFDLISNFLIMVTGLCAMLLMIFASGYLFIYNTMYISISKDIRYYGQLKTIGMTSVQLKRMVYRQAIWNAAAGIPLGLLASVAIAKIVIPQLLHIANPTISAGEVVSVRLWVFLLGGGFAFLTNLISCKKPAKMVGDCSPIEAIRFAAGSGKRKKRKRENGGICSMAVQNMFRDTKQAVIIFISFMIAILIFMVVNIVIRENDARHILDETYTYDIQFKNETTLDENRKQLITMDKISQIEAIEGVISVDKKGFEIMNQKLGNILNQDDFEQGKTAVALKYFTEGDNGITGKTVQFYFPGESKMHRITIAAVGGNGVNPAFFAGGSVPDLIVSEAYAKKIRGELFTELINVEYEEAYAKETEQKVRAVFGEDKEISYDSKLERYSEMKNTEMQVKALGNSAGLIIAVLAVLNYLNTIAASVQNRSREFAALESIGMTTGQIKKMLRAEGAGYAVISILLSLLLGLPVSYFVFDATAPYQISFSVPWIRNLILFIVVFILCIAAPVWIYQRTQNASVIERLRNCEE